MVGPQEKKRAPLEEPVGEPGGGRKPLNQKHKNGQVSKGESPALSSASACSMHCTVCVKDFATRLDWLSHLGELEHQSLARAECLEMWGEDKTMKECVVVVAVFCSFSLTHPGTVMDVLKTFSSGSGGRNLVTDFVWWPERPKLGFMQFESKHKVAEVLKGLEASSALVQNKPVQLKKATDILELEWKALLPPEISQEENLSSSVSSSSLPPICVPFPPSVYIVNAHTPLQAQFNSICKSIEIPEAECQHAMEISNVLKQIFRKHDPPAEIVIFRNYHLRLRITNDNNALFLFAYTKDPSDPHGFLNIGKFEKDSIFNCPEFNRSLPGFRKMSEKWADEGATYQHESSGFSFNLVTYPFAITEAYLSLLLQYLCTFDERVRPLFAIIQFWAKSQDVRIAEDNIGGGIRHTDLPDPVALEWLVILFLTHEGVIPSVREILQRPHTPLVVSGRRRDISFSFDTKYASDWSKSRSPPLPCGNSDEFLVSVITLAQKFFHFYATNLENGCWLLNPKDGEIIKREGTHYRNSKLTADEMDELKELQTIVSNRKHHIISHFRIYILHPLYIARKLSFCVDTWTQSTCAKMKQTAIDLEKYLNSIQSSDGALQPHVTLERVLEGGQRTRVEQRKRQGNRNSENSPDVNSGRSKRHKRK